MNFMIHFKDIVRFFRLTVFMLNNRKMSNPSPPLLVDDEE